MRPTIRPRSFALIYLALACTAAAFGQSSQGYMNDVGSTPYGVTIPVENGYINISNGNLHLEFPLASPPQRGALSLNERLVYDSRIWMFLPFGSNGSYHWWPKNVTPAGGTDASGGWRLVTGAEIGTTSYSQIYSNRTQCDNGTPLMTDPGTSNGPYDTTTNSSISWTDPGGTVHFFGGTVFEEQDCSGNTTTSIGAGLATDGSGYSISDDGTGNPLIKDGGGNQVYPSIIDRYGNYFSADSNRNVIDDTGRTPVLVSQSGNTTYYDVLAPNGPINNQGTRVRYTVTATPRSVSSDFQDWSNSDIHQWCNQCPPTQNNINLFVPVTSIQLPDGSQYAFGYDNTGELTSVTLPTGGTIAYGYTNIFDSSNTENRWLTSRTHGNDPAMTFTPSVATACSNYSDGCVERVNVHKPSGDETVYTLTLKNGAWNTGATAYTGSSSGGTPLVQVSSVNTYSNPCSSNCNGVSYINGSVSTKTLSTGAKSQTQSTSDTVTGKPTSIQEWDYVASGQSFASTPARETDYLYTGFDVQQVKVLSNGGTAGQTDYGYTSTPAATTSGIAQHGAQNAGGPYLNTVSHALIGGTPSTLTTTYGMDDTGQVVSTKDPNGNSSSVSYQCADSLPFQMKDALLRVTNYVYDCNSGAILSSSDPNDVAASRVGTTYAYEAVAGRIHTVTGPSVTGGHPLTTYSYPSSNEVDTTVAASPDPDMSSQAIVDSFGRAYQHVQAGVSSETTYDANGRVYCVYNPHGSSSSSTDGHTCITAYDGLDRPLTQQQPDGATLGWSYSGATTTSTDETNRGWQRTSDAFGHLIKVVEPDAHTAQYSYDGLGNLQSISQDDSVTRTFVHDSLSRLTHECHPEAIAAGQTCSASGPSWSKSYTYQVNGNTSIHTQTDARGVALQYTYDTLNRLTDVQSPGVSASSGNPYVAGFHYSYSYDSVTNSVGVKSTNSIGRLVAISNNVDAGQLYSYDAAGRMVLQGNYTPSSGNNSSIAVGAAYDLAGNLTSLTYPDGRTVKQGFLGDGYLHSVTFDNWNGNSVGYSYLSSASYFPDGTPISMTFGNGVTQSYGRNSRLQLTETRVANGSTTFFDKQFCHGPTNDPAAPLCTIAGGANNGNIQQVLDAQNSNNSQGFGYDSVNRLSSISNGSGTMQQTFGFYPYAGMQISGGGSPSLTTNQANGRFTNLTCASSLQAYDNAGNQLCDSDSNGANRVYAFDGNGQVANVAMQNGGTPFVSYTYQPDGSRVRKSTSDGNWTEYIYFNGQAIAEKTANGYWSDYIYANGQKIARADQFTSQLHTHGTCGTGTCVVTWKLPLPGGYHIQSGDKLQWLQNQTGGGQGGLDILYQSGNQTASSLVDSTGQPADSMSTQNQWVARSADLSNDANHNEIVSGYFLFTNGTTSQANPWDISYMDISIVSRDGTVTPIYAHQQGMTPTSYYNYNGGNLLAEQVTGDGGGNFLNTTYYHGDQLGSTRLATSPGGWPITSDTFYPFGSESPVSSSPNHYQYAGLERDPETGLDHATFRQYSASTGRWMSPDPYDGSMNLGNPQSLNRYNYVMNNPLGFTDPSGLEGGGLEAPACWTAVVQGGLNPGADIGCGVGLLVDYLFVSSFFNHPKFHGSHTSRPNAHIWDEHEFSYGANPGGALGLPGSGCEFGACGGIGGSDFQSAGVAIPVAVACIEAEPCGAIAGTVIGLGMIYQAIHLSKDGKKKPSEATCRKIVDKAKSTCTDLYPFPQTGNQSSKWRSCVRSLVQDTGCDF